MRLREPALAALLTPVGRGAVATIAVWGHEATNLVERYFHPASGRALHETTLGRVVFGRWATERGEQLVVVRSSTSALEIHAHGGHAAAAAILDDLQSAGVELVSADRWLEASAPDPWTAEAARALCQARTQRTAQILLDQYHGALGRELDAIRSALAANDRQGAEERCVRILARAELGAHLTQPWRVAIAGPPNVGKSSIINALVGYERAIVFDQPGTTRDLVTALVSFRGWPVELYDTAGLRLTADPLEQAGILLTEQTMRTVDLILLVWDVTQPWDATSEALSEAWPQALQIFNQADRLVSPQLPKAGLLTSATTGFGLPELIAAIVARLVPEPPRPGEAVPFNKTIVAEIERLRNQAHGV